ncbi:DAO-domain-containing protein [Daldinia sp. FL1419]|nr:DAO-domain-containing protein [Daldinia sp. FL1419]
MGSVQSSAKACWYSVTAAREFRQAIGNIMKRAGKPRGPPSAETSESYLLENPPYPEIVDLIQEMPSDHAEIIIIGSGITGAAAAFSVLRETKSENNLRRVLVLESRSMCSGGTGRGNGLLNCAPHEMYHRLRNTLGVHRARKIVKFQLLHTKVLMDLCQGMNWHEAEYREKEMVDLFLSEQDRELAFAKVKELRKVIPELKISSYNEAQARAGALTYDSATIWPFGFVNCVWNYLLNEYKPFLYMMTHTTVIGIEPLKKDPYAYVIHTTRGDFKCNHVVHATNAFAPDLVPGLCGKMTGILGTMAAIRPGYTFRAYDMGIRRAWSVVRGKTCDHVMQRPGDQAGAGTIIMSGGFSQATGHGASMIGGRETASDDGRKVKTWSGLMSVAGDLLPFVGRLDPHITGRWPDYESNRAFKDGHGQPDEWIAAGFGGDGLMWAWLSGTAVGIMVARTRARRANRDLGRPAGPLSEWFPGGLKPTLERLRDLHFNHITTRFIWSLLTNRGPTIFHEMPVGKRYRLCIVV